MNRSGVAWAAPRPHIRPMILYCGVDGGGTRTRAALTDAAGHLLGYGVSTASNPKAVGLDAAARAIGEAVGHAVGGHPLAGAVIHFFVGLAGVRTEHDGAAVAATLDEPFRRLGAAGFEVSMGGDIQNALAGALGGEPGVVLIAGTGSAAYGRNAAGEAREAGGWGWIIDDPGSGYWLGYQAMRAAARSNDGRGPRTSLEESVRAFLRLKTLNEMPNIIYNPHFSRERVAELSPILFEAAGEGDAVAHNILEEGFSELALMIATVARELGMAGAKAAAVGGVAESGAAAADYLRNALRRQAPDVRLVRPQVAPVAGALVLAMQAAGHRLDEAALAALDRAIAAKASQPGAAKTFRG